MALALAASLAPQSPGDQQQRRIGRDTARGAPLQGRSHHIMAASITAQP